MRLVQLEATVVQSVADTFVDARHPAISRGRSQSTRYQIYAEAHRGCPSRAGCRPRRGPRRLARSPLLKCRDEVLLRRDGSGSRRSRRIKRTILTVDAPRRWTCTDGVGCCRFNRPENSSVSTIFRRLVGRVRVHLRIENRGEDIGHLGLPMIDVRHPVIFKTGWSVIMLAEFYEIVVYWGLYFRGDSWGSVGRCSGCGHRRTL